MIYENVGQIIGKTPLLRLNNIEKEYQLKAKLVAKLEYLNPAGSIKDRVAASIITDAEEKGLINSDTVIIEPTSGNTGIGLASISASKGYKTILTMPETMSVERRNILKAYGAEIVLTDGSKGMQGAIDEAERLSNEIQNSFIAGQFKNPANPAVHIKTTGPEIWEDTEGKVDILVAGIGTGGTISGIGKYLKGKNPKIKVIGIEPINSAIITKGEKGIHKLQGIGAGFIPEVFDEKICDEIMLAEDDSAFIASKAVATKEGILVGISSGAALDIGIKLASMDENKDKIIVVILPDSADRYYSTSLFI